MKRFYLWTILLTISSPAVWAKHEVSIGVHHQQFDYSEVVNSQPFMESHGDTNGLSLHYQSTFKKHMVFEANGSQEFGTTNYLAGHPGVGAKYGDIRSKDDPHREHNLSALLGMQLPQSPNLTLTAKLGIHYRHFFQDTGQNYIQYQQFYIYAYNRETRYLTAPIELSAKMGLTPKMQLKLNAEYDYLLYGRQESYMSNSFPTEPDLKNIQHEGFGYQISAQLNFLALKQKLYTKLYQQYYHIADSRSKFKTSEWGDTSAGKEPDNKTVKTGIELGIRI